MDDDLSVTDEFLQSYEREKEFHERVSDEAAKKCDIHLSRSGIQASIKSRAKNEESLRRKIMQRDQTQHYKRTNDIRKDIIDLAGVRIALYFPNHVQKTEDLIKKIFRVHGTVQHPDENIGGESDGMTRPYVARFTGYKGKHFRVSIPEEKRTHIVEIQITSMLSHTWAEVSHDLIYKQMNGESSGEEARILDGLSGLIQVGEVLLEQLHDVYQSRSQSQNIKFANQYELGSFLLSRNLLPGINMGPLEVLLKFLTATGYDNPNQLVGVINNLELSGWDSSPIAQELEKARLWRPSLSVLVMEAILARTDDGVILKAEKDQADPDVSRFRSMAGAIILLDELFPPLRVWTGKLFLDDLHQNDRRRECSRWLNLTRNLQDVINRKRKPSSEERKMLTAPWCWFLNQHSDVIGLAFRVARMGLPDLSEFGLLRGQLLTELPFSPRVPSPAYVQKTASLSHRPRSMHAGARDRDAKRRFSDPSERQLVVRQETVFIHSDEYVLEKQSPERVDVRRRKGMYFPREQQ